MPILRATLATGPPGSFDCRTVPPSSSPTTTPSPQNTSTPTAITIGTFDGAHRGHAALVAACRAKVGPNGRVVVMAFDPHPMTRLKPEAVPARLTTFERREQLLRSAPPGSDLNGANEVVRLTPDHSLLSLTPQEFVGQVCAKYHPVAWVEGDDFHFGKARAGSVRTLAELAPAMGFECVVMPGVNVALDDHLVARASSTLVRWLLSQGRVRDAGVVLGRWYEFTGVVTKGDQRGRTIGVPTINLVGECVPPADGVYAAWAQLPSPDGRVLPCALNIGNRPTFRGTEHRVEAHVMDSSGSPATFVGLGEYGWTATLHIVAWLRDQVRFDGIDAIKAQLRRDTARAARVLAESSLAEGVL